MGLGRPSHCCCCCCCWDLPQVQGRGKGAGAAHQRGRGHGMAKSPSHYCWRWWWWWWWWWCDGGCGCCCCGWPPNTLHHRTHTRLDHQTTINHLLTDKSGDYSMIGDGGGGAGCCCSALLPLLQRCSNPTASLLKSLWGLVLANRRCNPAQGFTTPRPLNQSSTDELVRHSSLCFIFIREKGRPCPATSI